MKKETKIMIRLSEEENKIVEIYKTLNNLITKEESIKQIIRHAKTSLREGLKKGL